jgi:hypothetical protein
MTIQSPELSRSEVRMHGAASDPACLPRIECGTSIDELAAKLIDLCSGNHSVAMVYHFLLKAKDHNEESARAEFVRFLRGELSERLLQDARRWVQGEQARAELDGRRTRRSRSRDLSSKSNMSFHCVADLKGLPNGISDDITCSWRGATRRTEPPSRACTNRWI